MRNTLFAALAGTALLAATAPVRADIGVGFRFAGGINGIVVGGAPAPRPPVVYYPPPPVAYAPAPFAYAPPVVFGPPPVITYHPPPAFVHQPAPHYYGPPRVYHGPPRAYYGPPRHYAPHSVPRRGPPPHHWR